MTVTEFLEQYEEADRKVKMLHREYLKERTMADSIKSPLDTDGSPHGTGISNTVEDRALRIVDKALAYEEAKVKALEIRQRVFDAVNLVPGTMGEVLYLRYVELMKWDDIAEAIHYDKRTAFNYRDRGVEYLEHFIVFHC